MASLTLEQLFGQGATFSGGNVSFNVNSLVDKDGNPLVEITDDSDGNASERIMVSLLIYQSIVAKPVRDENDVDITPADRGIVYEDQTFSVGRTFVTRQDVNQIEHTITIKVYTSDNTGLQASDVV